MFTPVDMASVPSLLVRIGEQIDILLELADSLIEDKAFRTLASLSTTSRSFQDMLKPVMERTKKRILVEASDLCYLAEERYADIQYVQRVCLPKRRFNGICRIITSDCRSTYPEYQDQNDSETPNSFGYFTYQKGLRPWLLIYTGRPVASLSEFRTEYLPSVEIVRLSEDGVPRLGSFKRKRLAEPYDHALQDCMAPFLVYDPHTLGRLYPEGTQARVKLRYRREGVRRPWMVSTLRVVTAQDIVLETRTMTGMEELDEEADREWDLNGEQAIYTRIIPVSSFFPSVYHSG